MKPEEKKEALDALDEKRIMLADVLIKRILGTQAFKQSCFKIMEDEMLYGKSSYNLSEIATNILTEMTMTN